MKMNLFSHNEEAYRSALCMLEECGKAAVVHPTGTGKSFIGFKLCEEHPDKRICWLSPSEYIFKTQIENLKNVSDGWEPQNVCFYTYSKLMLMSREEINKIKPDFIVLDEFHRCGAEMWGQGVERLIKAFPDSQILGLSATAIRYLDNQRNMADELFDGNVASEMTLGEAIVRGILNPPKYVLSVFAYQKDFERIKSRVYRAKNRATRDAAEKYLESLRRALDMADGLDVIFDKHIDDRHGKYIVFCSDYEHLDEMRKKAGDMFLKVDKEPHIYIAYSDDPMTSKAFAKFKTDDSDHLKLLFCIDMLNEGVHVDDVSGVILFRPTVSPIIYKQQIGRALSANKNCVPVIFDIVNNIENLYSIGTVQQEMQAAVNYYRSLGESQYIVNDRFEVVDEVRDAKELFDSLNDTLTASWDTMYGYAKTYFKDHGNLEVPHRYKTPDGYSLGNWIFTQRKVRAGEQYGALDESRIEKLDKIGMIWGSMRDQSWNRFYAEAVKYKNENGDLKVPAQYVTKSGTRLGNWISNIRTYRKNGIQTAYLTKDRIKALDRLGMIWEVNDFLWDESYEKCLEYYRENGDIDIPAKHVSDNGIRLGVWLTNQRKRKAEGKLTEQQIQQLEALGIEWNTKYERAWSKGIAEAKLYHAQFGNLNVSPSYVSSSGFKLGDWITNRREYRRDRLSEKRREELDSLGMIWEKPDPWMTKYELAKAYYKEHGNLNIPADYKSDGVWIAKWLDEQKQIRNGRRTGKRLTENQIQMLDSIGMEWENRTKKAQTDAWQRGYSDAKAYFEDFGDLNVPSDYCGVSGKRLDTWIQRQRKLKNDGKLTKEQVELLEQLGIAWTTTDPWENGYTHAEEYYSSYGHLDVRSDYVSPDGYQLGKWIANQRANMKSTDKYRKVSPEHKIRLDSIGMRWDPSGDKWFEGYTKAKEYLSLLNGGKWMTNYISPDGFKTGEWIRSQVRIQKKRGLPAQKIKMLESIGIIFESDGVVKTTPPAMVQEEYRGAAV